MKKHLELERTCGLTETMDHLGRQYSMQRQQNNTILHNPITAIVSHIPLRHDPAGLYHGDQRDVLVVASKVLDITSRRKVEGLVPQRTVDSYCLFHVNSSLEVIDSVIDRIDSLVGYLSKEGPSPGFDYIRTEMMQRRGDGETGLVACAHDKDIKSDSAAKRLVPITWTDCAEEIAMLDQIAAQALAGKKYVSNGQLYV